MSSRDKHPRKYFYQLISMVVQLLCREISNCCQKKRRSSWQWQSFPRYVILVSLKQFLNPLGRDLGSLDPKMTDVTENIVILTPYRLYILPKCYNSNKLFFHPIPLNREGNPASANIKQLFYSMPDSIMALYCYKRRSVRNFRAPYSFHKCGMFTNVETLIKAIWDHI